mgnify:CR=1 FL=1
MKHYFIEINESKALFLLDILPIYAGLVQRHAFSKFQRVDEKRISRGENRTKLAYILWPCIDKITKVHKNNNRLEKCKFYMKKW